MAATMNNGMNGMFYAQQQPNTKKALMANPISDNEMKALQHQADKFSLAFDEEQMGRAICTHKGKDGLFSVIKNPDDSVTCTICHKTFSPNDCTPEYVEDAVRRITNVLETTKFLAVDLTPEVLRSFFTIGGYIEKLPQLYKLVNNSFNQYNNAGMFGTNVQAVNNAQNIFAAYNSIMSPGNPIYNGNPYMQQQAMMNNNMYQQPGMNPFYSQQQPMQQMAQPWGQSMPQQQVVEPVQQPQQVVQPSVQQTVDPNAQQPQKDVTVPAGIQL